MKSHVIVWAALAAAFVGILVGAGAYLGNLDFTFFLFAGIAVVIPLYRNSYVGCLLAYLAGGFIGLLISGFNIVVCLPYFVWFGLQPFLGCVLSRRGLKRWACYLVQIALLEAAIFVVLTFTKALIVKIDFLNANNWLFYLIGAAAFIPYDYMIHYIVNGLFRLLDRVTRR